MCKNMFRTRAIRWVEMVVVYQMNPYQIQMHPFLYVCSNVSPFVSIVLLQAQAVLDHPVEFSYASLWFNRDM